MHACLSASCVAADSCTASGSYAVFPCALLPLALPALCPPLPAPGAACAASCGEIAHAYAASLRRAGLVVRALFDVDIARASALAASAAFAAPPLVLPSLDGLLALRRLPLADPNRVCVVLNLTPPRLHFALNRSLLLGDMHVWSEKVRVTRPMVEKGVEVEWDGSARQATGAATDCPLRASRHPRVPHTSPCPYLAPLSLSRAPIRPSAPPLCPCTHAPFAAAAGPPAC